MGKASSAKKVARAARAGGSRRPGQRRPLGFPILVTSVIVLGVALVLFAKSTQEATAEPRPLSSDEPDHWHAAYGMNFCGDWVHSTEGDFLVDAQPDALGIHTHGDGVIHIHPFTESAAGEDAQMELFFDQVGMEVSDDEVKFPDGETWDEDEDTCTVEGEEVPGQIILAKWDDAQDAADGERPNDLFTEDFGDVHFENDGAYYTLAFVPEGQFEDIPVRPGILDSLANLTDVIEAPSTTATTATTAPGGESTTVTTAPGDTSATTATTAPGESSMTVPETTVPGDTSATTGTTAAGDTSTTATTTAG